MSTGKRITNVLTRALATVGASSLVAALVVVMVGTPLTEASASPTRLSAATAHAKFPSSVAAKAASRSALANAKNSATKAKPAKKKVKTRRVAKKRSTSYKTGWKSARVSWYGPGFYGHTMAGGGRLERNSMVVAHRSMKFGTNVLISYRGKSVVAVVKDRGPYVSGRTFDLGPGTAKALGFGGVGTIRYRIVR